MALDKAQLLNALRIDRSVQAEPRRSWHWSTVAGASLLSVALAAAVGGYAIQQRWLPMLSPSLIQEKAQTVRVAVARALPGSERVGPNSALLEATGYVVARRQATVGPKIAGKLRDVLVEEGMHVEANQVIAHLDDSNAVVARNQAKATLDQAEIAAANARPLFERSQAQLAKGLISREAADNSKATFDQSRTNVEVVRAALAVAQQNVDDTVVVAPFAGVVTVKAAQAGEIISPMSAGAGFTRTGIATIVDMDSLEVEVDVSENFINRVHSDQGSSVTLNAYADWQIPGHVIAVVPTADRSKATVKVRVGFNVKDPRILPEMGARVAFLADVKQNQESALVGATVPLEAVSGSGDQAVLFVIRDGRVERRPVKLGSRTAEGQIILSGMSRNETVAISDIDKLTDGEMVQVEQ
ncbi:MAG: efflux RND transporter periplasmic adaptor subunit [Xanthobacteraceae bacterium]